MEYVFVSFKEDRTVLAGGKKLGQTNPYIAYHKRPSQLYTGWSAELSSGTKWTLLLNKRQRLVHIKLNLIRETYAYLVPNIVNPTGIRIAWLCQLSA